LRLDYRVRGNGFLKHMIRNIVGTLIEVGKGNVTGADIQGMLAPGYGEKAGPRAPACGLYLVDVEFDKGIGPLPEADRLDDDAKRAGFAGGGLCPG
jgi:tRNA pseudouridine38-40 synthase